MLFDASRALSEGDVGELPYTGDVGADLKLVLRAPSTSWSSRLHGCARALSIEIVADPELPRSTPSGADRPLHERKQGRRSA